MKKIYLNEQEILKYPFYNKNITNEAEVRIFSSTELMKIFHFYSQNKVDTLYLLNKYQNDLALVSEFILFKKYIYNKKDLLQGILINKGYKINLRTLLQEGYNFSFNDLIVTLQNVGKVLEKLKYIRNHENKLTTFFIGDLQESNILVDIQTKKIQIIDLDSCKIENNRAFAAKYLEFLKTYFYVRENLQEKYPWDGYHFSNNENTDLYCYTMIILRFLFGVDIMLLDLNAFYNKMYDLKQDGLPDSLYQIFINLYNHVPNQNPYRLLDFIPSSFERKRDLHTQKQ